MGLIASDAVPPCGGGIVGTRLCQDVSLCCSQYGYCGYTAEYCDAATCLDARMMVSLAAAALLGRAYPSMPLFATATMATVAASQSNATLRPVTAVLTILAPGRLLCLSVGHQPQCPHFLPLRLLLHLPRPCRTIATAQLNVEIYSYSCRTYLMHQ